MQTADNLTYLAQCSGRWKKLIFANFEGFLIKHKTWFAKIYDSYHTRKTKIRPKASFSSILWPFEVRKCMAHLWIEMVHLPLIFLPFMLINNIQIIYSPCEVVNFIPSQLKCLRYKENPSTFKLLVEIYKFRKILSQYFFLQETARSCREGVNYSWMLIIYIL